MIGETISHYRILEKLGGGGMGVVYRAEDTRLRRTVALKFLPPELTRDENAKARFVQEAQAASALDHPNICTVHEIDETSDGQMFLALAYYDGETLKKRIQRGPCPTEDVVDIGCQIAEGLTKAHAHSIVHRDIKPANIMVTRDGLAKIVDFGLAKLPEATALTLTGVTMGTLAYMAPEQIRGESVDHRADIWATGVVLYEMVTGRRPLHADSAEALMYAILHCTPPPMRRLQPNVPVDFERIVSRALAKDVTMRYQRAIELNANYATAHNWYAEYLEIVGRGDEAIAEAERARALDPLSLILNADVGWHYYFARRYDEALQQLLKALEMDPQFAPTRLFLGQVYEQRAKMPDAIREFEAAVSLSGGVSRCLAGLGHACARAAQYRQARGLLEQLMQTSTDRYVAPNDVATVYLGLGEKDLAFEWLEKACEQRGTWLLFINVDPRFDPLREDPRFDRLLQRIGLPPAQRAFRAAASEESLTRPASEQA